MTTGTRLSQSILQAKPQLCPNFTELCPADLSSCSETIDQPAGHLINVNLDINPVCVQLSHLELYTSSTCISIMPVFMSHDIKYKCYHISHYCFVFSDNQTSLERAAVICAITIYQHNYSSASHARQTIVMTCT